MPVTAHPFLEALGLQHPIIQAPMAGVATPELAAAVSNAGALGSLGIGSSTASQARQMIEATQALTSRPFNVNVFCHAPAKRDAQREAAWLAHLAPLFRQAGAQPPASLAEIYKSFHQDDEMFTMLLETRPAVLSFHFGIPAAERLRAFKEAGIVTLATATSLREAEQIEAAGIDAIIAQGIEAGGHRGIFEPDGDDERLSTAVLVRQVVRRCSRPVIAAGGIMDGQGIAAMLRLGAVAAQLGTAFILCPESAANNAYRSNLKSDRAASTRLTPVLSGRPARGMTNAYITFASAAGSPPPADYPLTYDANKQLCAAAAKNGSHDFAAQWAGQGAPLAREMPAARLVQTLAAELRA
ncbi:nitronate monooxygenase [bacterium SGD-2]|nr:nitronate monooxygenase [bacterium SGD-2]